MLLCSSNNLPEIDLVFFWKQNDTGLYGRRSDMFLKYLPHHLNINMILQFDAPVGQAVLTSYKNKYEQNPLTHYQWIYNRISLRRQGIQVSERCFCYTFVSEKSSLMPESYLAFIRKKMSEHQIGKGGKKIVLWLCPSLLYINQLIETIRPDYIISDIIDDEREFSHSQSIKNNITRQYKYLADRSNLVLVNCPNMFYKIKHLNPNVRKKLHLLPNAADRLDISNILSPPTIAFFSHPTVVYAGNLGGRFDAGLLHDISIKLPYCTFLIIGSAHSNPEILNMEFPENVHFLGVVPYSDIGGYLKICDAAIIPHVKNRLSDSMNPLKVYLYLSAGLRIVSSSVSNIDTKIPLLSIAKNSDEFVKYLSNFFTLPAPAPDEYLPYIGQNSWDRRAEKLAVWMFPSKGHSKE